MTRRPMTNTPARWVRAQAIVAVSSLIGLVAAFALIYWVVASVE